MDKIKLALVGIGGYGKMYTDYILDRQDDRILPVGVADPFAASSPRLADLQKAGIPVYDSLDSLLAEQTPDLTVIVTPIQFHTPQILAALQAGSNVLCEKPLCADEGDIAILANASEKAGKFVFIGYQWSYSPVTLAIKKDIQSGKFGKCIDMKSMILWPRDFAYYHRGSGWAGKIRDSQGNAVYDSIANNATAHYLHNMLFVLGKDGEAATPATIRGELYRANDIENYDTCKVDLTMPDGAELHYLTSHAVDVSLNPTYHFRFEKANVYYAQSDTPLARSLLPADYTEYGKAVAVLSDGTRILYGDPFANDLQKLETAIAAAISDVVSEYPCGIRAASVHTRVINYLQKHETVRAFPAERLVKTDKAVYVSGLVEDMVRCWQDPTDVLVRED